MAAVVRENQLPFAFSCGIQLLAQTSTKVCSHVVLMLMQFNGAQDVATNEYHTLSDSDKAPFVTTLRVRGNACWDAEYYLEQYPDLEEAGYNLSTAWEHFVEHGQFENRVERYALGSLCVLTIPVCCMHLLTESLTVEMYCLAKLSSTRHILAACHLLLTKLHQHVAQL